MRVIKADSNLEHVQQLLKYFSVATSKNSMALKSFAVFFGRISWMVQMLGWFSADAGLQAGSGEREQADFGIVQHDECIVVVRSHRTLRQVNVNFAVLCGKTGLARFVVPTNGDPSIKIERLWTI